MTIHEIDSALIGTLVAAMVVLRIVRLVNGRGLASIVQFDRPERLLILICITVSSALSACEQPSIQRWVATFILALLLIHQIISRPNNDATDDAHTKPSRLSDSN